MTWRTILVLGASIALTACTVPLQHADNKSADVAHHGGSEVSPESRHIDPSNKPFSFVVDSYRLQSETAPDEDDFTMDGAPSSMKSNQAVIELTSMSALPGFLKKYNATMVRQSRIPALGKYIRYTDGTGRFESVGEEKLLPTYVVSFNDLDAVDSSALPALANAAGVKGEFRFNTAAGAKLFTKVLAIHTAKDPVVKHIGFNYMCKPAAVGFTAEGSWNGSSPYPTAPNNNQLWFTGPSWYGSFWGNNINSANTSVNSLHELSNASGKSRGQDISIAVIDNGYTSTGEGMNSSIFGNASAYYTWNFINGNGNIDGASTQGYAWHGRVCASLIFSPPNDSKGTIGTASRATPYIFRTDYSSAMNRDAIDTARASGVKILSMSFSTTSGWFNPMEWALDNCASANMINFASTGNDGSANPTYPASWSNTIGISGHGKNSAVATWTDSSGASKSANTQGASLYAACPDVQVAAPPTSYSSYVSFNGTSASCPIVAGVAAILVQQGKASNNSTADSRLYNTGYSYTAGRALNALGAAN